MTNHFPKTLMTLALGAMIATTGITSANASVGTETYKIQAAELNEQVVTPSSNTQIKPGVTIPLIKQASIIDRLSSVTSTLSIQADPSVKLSFERPAISSMPNPEIAIKKKAEEDAKIAAEKASAEKAAADKVAADKALAEAEVAAKTATTVAQQNSAAPATKQGNSSAASTPAPNLPQNLSSYQQYAAQAMSARGLNGTAELTCLIPLWHHESGWNPNAANPSSSARGIPQMMMNIHYGANWQSSAAGVAYLNNPQVQVDKGLDYIIGRYGSPCNAWNTWQTQSWY